VRDLGERRQCRDADRQCSGDRRVVLVAMVGRERHRPLALADFGVEEPNEIL
jgi:hypothetical protein